MKHLQKFTLLTTVLFIFHYARAAEQMHSINAFKDLQPFLGKIVVFDSDKYYFSGGTHSYQIHNSLRIAFINSTLQSFINKETGITMRRVVKKGTHVSMCALLPSTIKTAHLKIRAATAEECATIHNAIVHNQAELEAPRSVEKVLI